MSDETPMPCICGHPIDAHCPYTHQCRECACASFSETHPAVEVLGSLERWLSESPTLDERMVLKKLAELRKAKGV